MHDQFKCDCDCGCDKQMTEAVNPNSSLNQCKNCDDGIHWDDLNKVFVDYEEEEKLR